MLCCLLEMSMTVFGIVVLVKGRFSLSGTRPITGGRAYLIGAMLTATLPLTFAVGMVIGFLIVASGGTPQQPLDARFVLVDCLVVFGILLGVLVTAATGEKTPRHTMWNYPMDGGPPPSFPPPDPDNPYSPPHADDFRPPEQQ